LIASSYLVLVKRFCCIGGVISNWLHNAELFLLNSYIGVWSKKCNYER